MTSMTKNALKYTPSGHILVTLSKQWLQRTSLKEGNAKKAMISLKVRLGRDVVEGRTDRTLGRRHWDWHV